MEKTRAKEILAGLTIAFSLTKFYDKGKNEAEIKGNLAKFLAETEYPTDDILTAIKAHLGMSPNAPTPADIMAILRSNDEKIEQKELDRRWQYFLDFGFNSYAKLEDWAYDIKKALGWQRIDNLRASDMVWLRKDFDDQVKRQIKGEIEVLGDKRKWVQIGNTLCLESTKKTENSIKKIGTVLDNQKNYAELTKFKIKRYIDTLTREDLSALQLEVSEKVIEELFNKKLGTSTALYQAMIDSKINLIVEDRLKEIEKNQTKLKVVG